MGSEILALICFWRHEVCDEVLRSALLRCRRQHVDNRGKTLALKLFHMAQRMQVLKLMKESWTGTLWLLDLEPRTCFGVFQGLSLVLLWNVINFMDWRHVFDTLGFTLGDFNCARDWLRLLRTCRDTDGAKTCRFWHSHNCGTRLLFGRYSHGWNILRAVIFVILLTVVIWFFNIFLFEHTRRRWIPFLHPTRNSNWCPDRLGLIFGDCFGVHKGRERVYHFAGVLLVILVVFELILHLKICEGKLFIRNL